MEEYLDFDTQTYNFQTALELAQGVDEVLSNELIPIDIRIRTVLQATNIFLKYMAKEGYLEYEVEQ